MLLYSDRSGKKLLIPVHRITKQSNTPRSKHNRKITVAPTRIVTYMYTLTMARMALVSSTLECLPIEELARTQLLRLVLAPGGAQAARAAALLACQAHTVQRLTPSPRTVRQPADAAYTRSRSHALSTQGHVR